MMDTFTVIFSVMLIAHIVFTGIVVFNYFKAFRIENIQAENSSDKMLSILVPARNEEKNIGNIIASIENQDYTNYELIIVDDNSEDATYETARDFAERNSKIKVVRGGELPPGWLGKNWTCCQLAQQASGDPFLFIDADVQLEKSAVGNSLALLKRHNLSMLSVFPSQIIRTFGERLIVPLMNWFLLSFLPLNMVYTSRQKSFVAANGQFLMITREMYDKIGTHEMFRDKVVEDMEIARAVKLSGRKIMTCLGNNVIKAEMYNSFAEAFNGFSKNFFPGFNTGKFLFISLIIIVFSFYSLPAIFVFFSNLFLLLILMIIIQRILLSIINKESVLLNVLLHPLQMVMMLIIGFSSTFRAKKVWKGRQL